ncbi:hypothetical protein [Paenibacillus dendritiformis]|uniref:Phage transcriptional regulator, RinA family protein n=1 Tax=Paenibacillus dendritiformis C454 TaxID=1131935 RepID=H3SAB9_9BACL|nr:hypothetical protein [Paenibacillus dendritiformis]EHQ63922.1 phage transcriptional regulator, RinA family protein [Paenibacillus dendritiformis C454]CAH8772246.1 transcriptional regulator [Paenibacillus dendritiformis]
MTIATKIRKATFQHVEAELRDYDLTRREIIRMKNELLYGAGLSDDDNVGGGRSNLPGDPTGRTATLMVTHRKIEQMQRVVDAIEYVIGQLPDDKKKLVQLKYWTRPQTLTWEGIALRLGVSARHAMRWRDEIISAITEKIGWR